MREIKSLQKGSLVGLDTNIFIYYFQKHPLFGPKTREMFEYFSENKIVAITSNITLIELLAFPLPPNLLKQLENDLLSFPILKVQEVTNQIALESARIRREYGFRLPDSIQIATALQAKAQAFISNDQKLKQFKGLKVVLLKQV